MNTGINRIRLEFKEDHSCFLATKTARVLIESDWNLKVTSKCRMTLDAGALIESDWNLKSNLLRKGKEWLEVLIESDWNLNRCRL